MSRIEIDPTEFDLEETCWRCGGTGKWDGGPCSICNGLGYQTTSFGDMVLRFIEHHWEELQARAQAKGGGK